MLYDLHCHSTASDGSLTPEAVVQRAHARGVGALALTDHDTTIGLAEAAEAARSFNMRFIAGIELTAQWQGRSLHVLGLNIQPNHPSVQQAQAHQWGLRTERALAIAQKLSQLNLRGALEGAQRYAGQGVICRPHFAQFIVDSGAAPSVNAAFKKYLAANKPADVKVNWPSLMQVIQWINDAGGIAVLAHPDKYTLTRTKLNQLLQAFTAEGGRGLEVISGRQLPGIADRLAVLAHTYNLLASCGSDFHHPNQPWQELGSFGKLPHICQPIWQAWPTL